VNSNSALVALLEFNFQVAGPDSNPISGRWSSQRRAAFTPLQPLTVPLMSRNSTRAREVRTVKRP